jgi:hypothetical protein
MYAGVSGDSNTTSQGMTNAHYPDGVHAGHVLLRMFLLSLWHDPSTQVEHKSENSLHSLRDTDTNRFCVLSRGADSSAST